MIIKAVKLSKKEIFNIDVTKDNYIQVRQGLEQEKTKFIDKLKQYKAAGLIGSVNFPRNKHLQKELDEIVKKKKLIKNSIEQINKVFLS